MEGNGAGASFPAAGHERHGNGERPMTESLSPDHRDDGRPVADAHGLFQDEPSGNSKSRPQPTSAGPTDDIYEVLGAHPIESGQDVAPPSAAWSGSGVQIIDHVVETRARARQDS